MNIARHFVPAFLLASLLSGCDEQEVVSVPHHVQYKTGLFSDAGNQNPADVYAITQDLDGTIWVGTNDGVATITNDVVSIANDDPFLYVLSALTRKNGDVWFGTLFGVTAPGANGEWAELPTQGFVRVNCMIEDSQDRVWLGTDNGILIYDNITQEVPTDEITFSSCTSCNRIRAFFRESNDVLWIGTDDGLIRYSDDEIVRFTTADGLPGNEVYAVHGDSWGDLWIGTAAGIARRDGDGFAFIPDIEGLPKHTTCIASDGRENLWFGTLIGPPMNHKGIVLEATSFRSPDAHFGWNYVNALYKDTDGNIWAGTDAGVVLINIQ